MLIIKHFFILILWKCPAQISLNCHIHCIIEDFYDHGCIRVELPSVCFVLPSSFGNGSKTGSSSCLSVLIRTGDTFRRCLLEVFWPESVILQNCSNCFISLLQAKTTENNKVPNLPDLGMSNEVKCTVSWILLCVVPCLLICKGVN